MLRRKKYYISGAVWRVTKYSDSVVPYSLRGLKHPEHLFLVRHVIIGLMITET